MPKKHDKKLPPTVGLEPASEDDAHRPIAADENLPFWAGRVFTKKEWVAWHHSPEVITASEVAIILGLSKWESPFTLYMKKTGQIPPFEGNLSTRVGKMMEPLICELYEDETMRVCMDPGEFTMHHKESGLAPWLWCTVDRLDDDARAVELKNLGGYSLNDWRNKLGPIEYQVQNQVQLYCTGLEKGSLAGLINNREFFYHDFERQDSLLSKIITKCAEFRDRCMNGDAPPIDHTDSSTQTLKALHPKDTGEVRYDDSMAEYMTKRKELKAQEAHLKRDLKECENKLKETIGDASELWANGMKMTWKHQHRKGGYVKASDSRRLIGPK